MKAKLHPMPIVGIGERWSLDDHVLISQSAEFLYLMTLVENITLWVEAYPCKSIGAPEVAKILANELFPRHGICILQNTPIGSRSCLPFGFGKINAICWMSDKLIRLFTDFKPTVSAKNRIQISLPVGDWHATNPVSTSNFYHLAYGNWQPIAMRAWYVLQHSQRTAAKCCTLII